MICSEFIINHAEYKYVSWSVNYWNSRFGNVIEIHRFSVMVVPQERGRIPECGSVF